METPILKEAYKSFQIRVYYNVVNLSIHTGEKGERIKNLSLAPALIKIHIYKSKITGTARHYQSLSV